jgi:ketosteroid isomerase-like protein
MSRENVEIVRAIYDAYDRGDYEAAFEYFHVDIEWFEPPENPGGGGVYRGHEGVRESLGRWIGQWDDYHFELRELTNVGDCVLAEGWQRGRGRGSGVEVSEETFHVWTLQAGKVVRFRGFRNKAQALEAVGLRE